ncbi:protein-disulfide reductase DsbD [Sulfurimonas sp. HSL-1716]|uniref:protein-disulfide reductase DsbD n=1 Tax=Hydrocurvibacter sulfurireducens TaxID=3131937 RepID=UPI0031F7D1E5
MKKLLLLLILLSIFTLAQAQGFLLPNEAFKPSVTVDERSNIIIDIVLGKDIYLYEKDLKISLKKNDALAVESIDLPKSVKHEQDKVYMNSPHIIVKLKKLSNAAQTAKVDLVLGFQGCSLHGLCYEPQEHTYTLNIDTAKITSGKIAAEKSVKSSKKQLSETDDIANTLKSGNILFTLGMFLVFGLLLSMTPCVFPMIPIISSVIVSQGEGLTTKRAFFLSVVYVLSMSVAYTIAGILAGLFGANLQAALQTPWVIYSFAGIFVLLSLSMFDVYELQVPSFIQSKVSSATSNRGGIIGVAIMGFLSALIVGPCVAAPLAGALVYIGQTGDALLGGAALFMLSIGMGIPLIVVGTGAGKFMPRPGGWMELVKTVFGLMMLGVAIWMVSRVLDEGIVMMLWAVLAIASGVHFGALEPLQVENGERENSFKKIIAVIILLYGVILFIGALSGSKEMLSPLDKFTSRTVESTAKSGANELQFKRVTNMDELDAALAQAKGKKVVLDFAASWCTACKELDETTFKDKDVIDKMKEFVLIRADISANTDKQKAVSKKYGVFGPPVIVFMDENGTVLEDKTITGYKEAKEFLKHLESL